MLWCALCALSAGAGGATVAYLSMRASRTYSEIKRLEYRNAEERAAVCAKVAGRMHEAVWHYRNVVAAEVAPRTDHVWTLTFPFAALVLERIEKRAIGDLADERRVKVEAFEEGQLRARLGKALEDSGQLAEANDQYLQAERLIGRDRNELRAWAQEYPESEAAKMCSDSK